MSNGATSPISVAVTDPGLRAAIEEALDALEAVHALPAGAPPVTIDVETLPDGRSAEFRVMSDGSLVIVLDPDQSITPRLDVLHEIGHYVDWAVLPPPSIELSTIVWPADLEAWLDAVSASDAIAEMDRIQTNPATVSVTLDDGTTVELDEDPAIAAYAMDAWEVFARSYCQWIAERSGNPDLQDELNESLQNHYPEQWSHDDFEPIARAIDDLLGGDAT